ncbi:MAG: helix-turn-helix transcriptional regulator [Sphingomonadales bacterium]|jgi:DNA-binding CsgD family transcriptional regulator
MLNGTSLKKTGTIGAAALDFGAFAAMCPIVTTPDPADSPRNPRVTLLTEAERECLRLVYQHMTSKDIARQLGVSPHTVDMRLRQAIRKLEVTNRVEAARALLIEELTQGLSEEAAAEAAARGGYQPLIYQAPEIVDGPGSAIVETPASLMPGAASARSSDPNPLEHGSLARTLHQEPDRPVAGPQGGSLAQSRAPSGNVAPATLATDWPGIAAPDPGIDARPFLATRPWGSRNTLGIGQRLGWIMAIAMASALSFGGILAALAALKTLL